MNQALTGTAAPVLAAVNPDTVPPPGSIAELAHRLLDAPEVGLVAPRLADLDGGAQHSACRDRDRRDGRRAPACSQRQRVPADRGGHRRGEPGAGSHALPPRRVSETLFVAVSDYGHGDRRVELIDTDFVQLQVE
jgi:hypothetical protein